MATGGFFNITVYGQIKYKHNQDVVIKSLQDNVKKLDEKMISDSTTFGGMMMIINFSGTMTEIGNFGYWLTRFRTILVQYFRVAEFQFNMTYGE